MFVIQYIKEVFAIIKQITWPTRETLTQLSIVVIFLSFAIALLLGGFDFALTSTIGELGRLRYNQPIPTLAPIETIATPSATLAPTQVPKIPKTKVK